MSPDHAAAARAWLSDVMIRGVKTGWEPKLVIPAAMEASLERLLAETAAAARRTQREADAAICDRLDVVTDGSAWEDGRSAGAGACARAIRAGDAAETSE